MAFRARFALLLSFFALLSLHTSARADAKKTVPLPPVSFLNDVVPALTRIGCNQGACHGAAAGKGGFKLTLRGFAPELDYVAILKWGKGRRVCLSAPDQSLFLKKPLLEVPHRGGMVLRKGTPEYALLRGWLKQGAPGPNPHDPHVVSIEPRPAFQSLTPKSRLNLRVLAHFSDGKTRDVTYWTRFGSNNEDVASVHPGGLVNMAGYGETAITLAYQNKVSMARVGAPFPNAVKPSDFLSLPRNNFIDGLVYAKLAQLRLWPSALTKDADFARRVSLDLTGTLPSPEAIRAFAGDKNIHKRDAYIDGLMSRPEFVDYWTYVWCDLFKVNRGTLKDKGMWAFYNYMHESIAANKPWDQLCREVLNSTGNTFLDGPANYYRTAIKTEEVGENISQAFLGVRVQCAKCHNHPLEHWTQNEYYGMANLFARVGRKADFTPGIDEEMIVYNQPSGDIVQPRLGHPVPPKPLGGPELALNAPEERRAFFVKWLTGPKNTQFAKCIVNRVWAHLMGRGLIDPVDDIRDTNPPTNPALLDALTSDFIRNGYDLRRLMRLIVTSRAYQLDSNPNPRNRQDTAYYSRYLVHRLTAEQILDALSQVTGQSAGFSGVPASYRALQLPDTRVKSEFMDSFGRPARQITCECERSQEPNMTQALLFINGDTVNSMVGANGGLVDRLTKAGKSDGEILDTLYWTALGRSPSASERALDMKAIHNVLKPVAAVPPAKPAAPPAGAPPAAPASPAPAELRRHAFEDMLWALVNSKEFLFNH